MVSCKRIAKHMTHLQESYWSECTAITAKKRVQGCCEHHPTPELGYHAARSTHPPDTQARDIMMASKPLLLTGS